MTRVVIPQPTQLTHAENAFDWDMMFDETPVKHRRISCYSCKAIPTHEEKTSAMSFQTSGKLENGCLVMVASCTSINEGIDANFEVRAF